MEPEPDERLRRIERKLTSIEAIVALAWGLAFVGFFDHVYDTQGLGPAVVIGGLAAVTNGVVYWWLVNR